MNIKIASSLFLAFYRTIGYLFVFIALGLYLDSKFLALFYENTQLIATIIIIIGFSLLFYKSPPRIREHLVTAVIIGYFGEHLFSIILGMYTYRLGNVPLYIPQGHAIVYIATLYFCKEAVIKSYRKQIEIIFSIFVLVYASLFLVFANDIFGFIMSILVLFLLRNKPRERLFYLTMYVVVAYLEIIGTQYECWVWPKTAFGIFPFLKSANPPSGISLFYFLLDLGCLWIYKQRHLIAWNRMKNLRELKKSY